MRSTVEGLTGKGRTPIGNSLLAVPDDLGPAEGRRTVDPRLRRRRQLRPAGPVRGRARGLQAGHRPLDLGRRPAGQRARPAPAASASPRPAAGPTSTSTTPTSSRTSSRRALARVPQLRAGRDEGHGRAREPAGRGAAGRALPGRDPRRASTRWYAVDVPRGKSLLASVTAIPSLRGPRAERAADRAAESRPRARRRRLARCSTAPRRASGRVRAQSLLDAGLRRRGGAATGPLHVQRRDRGRARRPTPCRSRSACSCCARRDARADARGRVSSARPHAHPDACAHDRAAIPAAPRPRRTGVDVPVDRPGSAIGGHRGRADRRAGAHPEAPGMSLRAALAAALVAAAAGRRPGGCAGAGAGGRRGSFTDRADPRAGHYRDTVLPEEYLYYGVRRRGGAAPAGHAERRPYRGRSSRTSASRRQRQPARARPRAALRQRRARKHERPGQRPPT